MGQIPIAVMMKYNTRIIISPLVVNNQMFFFGKKVPFVVEGIS